MKALKGIVESCIVMAGGKAERMSGVVKPLLDICGVKPILRIIASLRQLCVRIIVAYAPYTRKIADFLHDIRGVELFETSGAGYAADLALVLRATRLPALVVPSDIVEIRSKLLERFAEKALEAKEDVINLVDSARGYTGISVVKTPYFSSWRDIVMGEKIVEDMDTWEDYLSLIKRCATMAGNQ